VRAGFIECIAWAQIPRVLYWISDGRYRRRREVRGEPPGRADEGRTVNASGVATRRIMCADVTREDATLDLGSDLIERTVTAPAVRNSAHMLPKLAV
jgi:hypothetical protein